MPQTSNDPISFRPTDLDLERIEELARRWECRTRTDVISRALAESHRRGKKIRSKEGKSS